MKFNIAGILIMLGFASCGQISINGQLQSTHWSPDSTMYVEVYKEKLEFAMPGQGSDHTAIIVLRRADGTVENVVDGNSMNSILLRSFYGVSWDMERKKLNYAPARNLEWIDEDFDVAILREDFNNYLGTEDWDFFRTPEIFKDKPYVIGEFFGDEEYDYTLDIAVLIENAQGEVQLYVFEAYNYNHYMDGISPINLVEGYEWVGNFKKVESGSAIWSNWVEGKGDDGSRTLEETPAEEILKLEYDALYLHAGESCGGGFVFWKDRKWQWRQQE